MKTTALTRLIAGGCQRSGTEMATCRNGFRISEGLRMRLYNAFIVPVHMYCMDPLGLTPTEWALFDAFDRRQLRQVIDIIYPPKISSKALCERI